LLVVWSVDHLPVTIGYGSRLGLSDWYPNCSQGLIAEFFWWWVFVRKTRLRF